MGKKCGFLICTHRKWIEEAQKKSIIKQPHLVAEKTEEKQSKRRENFQILRLILFTQNRKNKNPIENFQTFYFLCFFLHFPRHQTEKKEKNTNPFVGFAGGESDSRTGDEARALAFSLQQRVRFEEANIPSPLF